MGSLHLHVEIAAPRDRVFVFFVPQRMPLWYLPEMQTEFEVTGGESDFRTGQKVRISGRLGSREVSLVAVVQNYEWMRALEWEFQDAYGVRGRQIWELDDARGFGGAGKAPVPVGVGGAGKAPVPVGFGGAGKAPVLVGSGGAGKAPVPVGFGGPGKGPVPIGFGGPGKRPVPVPMATRVAMHEWYTFPGRIGRWLDPILMRPSIRARDKRMLDTLKRLSERA